jgi:HAE1 family hydrophobic/amphiphilic exporter-1
MFLSDLSIKQPVLATMMMAALAVLGLTSYQALQVDMFPDVEFPVVTITTHYTGASPETVERDVTKFIEEAVNTVEVFAASSRRRRRAVDDCRAVQRVCRR